MIVPHWPRPQSLALQTSAHCFVAMTRILGCCSRALPSELRSTNYYVCPCILSRSPGVHRIRVPECPADCMHCMQPDRMIQSLIVDSLGGYPRSTKKYTVHVPLRVLMSVLKAGLENHVNQHGAARSYPGVIWPGPDHIPPSSPPQDSK